MQKLDVLIRNHRRKSGLSQAELAKLAGVGKTVVFDLEHGKESVQLDTLRKVLKVLNITMRFESPLLDLIGEQESNETQRSEAS